jgi:hypothetical protein
MGVVEKQGQAAVIFAAVALKSILLGNLIPGFVHILVKFDQG